MPELAYATAAGLPGGGPTNGENWAYVQDEQINYKWTGSAWIVVTQYYQKDPVPLPLVTTVASVSGTTITLADSAQSP